LDQLRFGVRAGEYFGAAVSITGIISRVAREKERERERERESTFAKAALKEPRPSRAKLRQEIGFLFASLFLALSEEERTEREG